MSHCCCLLLHLIRHTDICLLAGPDHDDVPLVCRAPGAGQARAQEESQADQDQPQPREAGPHHPQLQGPEAPVPQPHRGDHHPHRHQQEAQVQQDVNVGFI